MKILCSEYTIKTFRNLKNKFLIEILSLCSFYSLIIFAACFDRLKAEFGKTAGKGEEHTIHRTTAVSQSYFQRPKQKIFLAKAEKSDVSKHFSTTTKNIF